METSENCYKLNTNNIGAVPNYISLWGCIQMENTELKKGKIPHTKKTHQKKQPLLLHVTTEKINGKKKLRL